MIAEEGAEKQEGEKGEKPGNPVGTVKPRYKSTISPSLESALFDWRQTPTVVHQAVSCVSAAEV